jgi:hypothetical protein
MVQASGLECSLSIRRHGKLLRRRPMQSDGAFAKPCLNGVRSRLRSLFSPKGWSIVAEGNALGRSR